MHKHNLYYTIRKRTHTHSYIQIHASSSHFHTHAPSCLVRIETHSINTVKRSKERQKETTDQCTDYVNILVVPAELYEGS